MPAPVRDSVLCGSHRPLPGQDLTDLNLFGYVIPGPCSAQPRRSNQYLWPKRVGVALNALGFAYRDGVGVSEDLAKSQVAFEKAAGKGNPVALFELGSFYETGKVATKDLIKAHVYYNLAAARQHPNASEALQRVSSQLSPEEILRAQAEAKSWKADG